MGKSSIRVVDHPNGKIAQVFGVIDGSFDPRPLLGGHEIMLFDLDGVERITSFGVREWRAALRQLTAKYIGFIRCHPSLVAQFNLVPGFAAGGDLISFYLPYVCPTCDQVSEELLDLRSEGLSVDALEPPPVACGKCGAAMEFDDIPAAYFKHARSVPQPRPPAAASAMIDYQVPEAPRRELSVRKEVEDTVTAFWLAGALDDRRALRRLTDDIEGQTVLVLGELEEASDDGLAGLVGLLRAVGEAYLCLVPAALVPRLVDRLKAEQLEGARLISITAAPSCPGCRSTVNLGLDAARLAVLRADEPAPFARCPRCGHQLGAAAVPEPVLAATARMPLGEPPEPVQIYLDNRVGAEARVRNRSYSAPSQLLFGNYRILKRLGEGGMGEVLLARYVGVDNFEKLVVLKRISREYVTTPGAIQEFQREARVTARLSHPNIVQVFDFSKLDDEYFFAMEYVNGVDLRQALRLCRSAGLRWPPLLCMRVISDVCAGLEAAHNYKNEAGVPVPIYHRDISPENIIISLDGAVKLTDFGIAKTADSSVATASGVFKGKHAYSAPEQMEDGAAADHRTDIYAAGIVLFELLSLRRYLGDEPTLSMAYAASRRPPVRLTAERDDIPEGLQPIFDKATAAERTARYQGARELREDLEQLMKRGAYPTSDDLAAWIRKVMTLRAGGEAGHERTMTTDQPDSGDAMPTTRGHTLPNEPRSKEQDGD